MAQEFEGPVIITRQLEVKGRSPNFFGNINGHTNIDVEGAIISQMTMSAPAMSCTQLQVSSPVAVSTFNCNVEVNGIVRVSGDIELTNGDCAEEFPVKDNSAQHVCPGMVVVLSDEGSIQVSRSAYDKRVAGVVSGGGDHKPAIILDKGAPDSGRIAVALIGKVACNVDASYGAVEVGDLLTTSDTPGHAMKASDSSRAFGSIIGKALRPFKEGQGLIPILVALQ